MELLQAEIARKRKLNADIRGSSSSSSNATDYPNKIVTDALDGSGGSGGGLAGIKTKYVKQSDVIKRNEELALKAQQELDSTRRSANLATSSSSDQGNDSSNNSNDSSSRSNNNNNNNNSSSSSSSNNAESDLKKSRKEADSSFSSSSSSNNNNSNSSSNNSNNYNSSSNSSNNSNSNSNSNGSSSNSNQVSDTSASLLEEKNKVIGKKAEKEKKEDKEDEALDLNIKYSQIPGYPTEKVIYKYFRTIVKVWALDLEAREEKGTMAYKIDIDAHRQIKDNVKPLFDLCKNKGLDASLLEHLKQMVAHCEVDDFRGAHDWYLRAAIGNAAWPMGITMAGIHERSGRERISTSKVAHVMNSEQHRKFLTAVKRLMTYAQSKRPGLAPSMMMLN